MTILGIETSCDETAAAIIEGHETYVVQKSNVLATSLAMHAKTGGIIPEQAAREQVKYILPVIAETLKQAELKPSDIDAIAVTYGPGLIGSLLVGVETAKTLSYILDKPIIPVNHMVGHIYANFIDTSLREGTKQSLQETQANKRLPLRQLTDRNDDIAFPLLALVISGGHTDLLLMKKHGDFQLLGGTRDDAAGECFDKIGRMLGIAYPAGPEIERLAHLGNPKRFRFPRPLIGSDDYDFSFSGLKTAVLREVMKLRHSGLSRISHGTDFGVAKAPQNDNGLDAQTTKDIARATQDAIIDVIIKKTLKAAKEHQVKSIILSGGVAANQTLTENFSRLTATLSLQLSVPTKTLCTDNAAMIAAAAYFNYHPVPWKDVTADPELYFD